MATPNSTSVSCRSEPMTLPNCCAEDLEAPVQGLPFTEHMKDDAHRSPFPLKSRQVMPIGIDLDGDGVISMAEARAATNQLTTLRRGFFIVLALLGVQQVMMFGTVYWATQLASEVHVRNTEMEDDDGRPVSTLQRRDRIDGLHYAQVDRRLSAEARRLNETSGNASDAENATSTSNDTVEAGSDVAVSDIGGVEAGSDAAVSDVGGLLNLNESVSSERGFHGNMEISKAYFQSTWEGYMTGKSDWVVPFPDGSVRTVFIQGMSAAYAWGICGACPGGNVQWEATCPFNDDLTECSVEYEEVISSRLRRLGEKADAVTSPLLARARANQQDEGSEMQGLERSLGGKHCA